MGAKITLTNEVHEKYFFEKVQFHFYFQEVNIKTFKMGRIKLLISILACICLLHNQGAESRRRKNNNKEDSRQGKLLSLFQIIKFENGVCAGTSSINGTCYTADECEEKGGKNSGSCAEGFGVCCTFSLSCGSSSSENNTHLVQTSTTAVTSGMCQYKICKQDADICRIRLDFNTFAITGPQAGTTVAAGGAGGSGGSIGNCATDSFSITAPGSAGSPVICGFNTGQHMIVDASDMCHLATFSLGGGAVARQWDIRVTQYTCDPRSRGGPSGCLQYFTGLTGTISSYNFPTADTTIAATTTHLSSQNYRICVRQESGRCNICYTTAVQPAISAVGDQASFGLSASDTAIDDNSVSGAQCTADYILIPSAQDVSTAIALGVAAASAESRICGRGFASITATTSAIVTANSVSVCSQTVPFTIDVFTNLGEAAIATDAITNEADTAPGGIVGFSLDYAQGICP